MIDEKVAEYLEKSPNLLVPWYLITSYAYYVLDEMIISDGLYDSICKWLLGALRAGKVDHMHAYLCNEEALAAGTAYHIAAYEYPSRAVVAAHQFSDMAMTEKLIPW
jgi:hypothetical protein